MSRVSFDIKFTIKALRTLIGSRGLPSDWTCVLEAEPGKLDIKRREPGILFISTPQTIDDDVIIDFCVDLALLATSFKKWNIVMT